MKKLGLLRSRSVSSFIELMMVDVKLGATTIFRLGDKRLKL